MIWKVILSINRFGISFQSNEQIMRCSQVSVRLFGIQQQLAPFVLWNWISKFYVQHSISVKIMFSIFENMKFNFISRSAQIILFQSCKYYVDYSLNQPKWLVFKRLPKKWNKIWKAFSSLIPPYCEQQQYGREHLSKDVIAVVVIIACLEMSMELIQRERDTFIQLGENELQFKSAFVMTWPRHVYMQYNYVFYNVVICICMGSLARCLPLSLSLLYQYWARTFVGILQLEQTHYGSYKTKQQRFMQCHTYFVAKVSETEKR